MKKNSTEIILNSLVKAKNLEEFFKENDENLGVDPFTIKLRKFISNENLSISDLIRQANLDTNYAYQIINGTRKPSRNKIIQISIALGLELSETNQLLCASERQTLYVKVPRDAVIIFCIISGFSIYETNEALMDKNFETLY